MPQKSSRPTLSVPGRLALLGLLAGGSWSWLELWAHRDLLWVWGAAEAVGVILAALSGAMLGAAAGWVLARPRTPRPFLPSQKLVILSLALLLILGGAAAGLVRRSQHISIPTQSSADLAPGVIDTSQQPDIFVFLLDALRRDGIQDADGGILPIAPSIRDFAKGAVVFSQARSTAPWTVPTHASLFTGLSSLDHGTTQETPYVDSELTTLAERLSEAGYLTAGLIVNPWISQARGYSQGFAIYEELWPARERVPFAIRLADRIGLWQPLDRFHREKGTGLAMRRFERLLAATPSDRPLFVFVNIISAHPLLGAPQPYHDQCMPSQLVESGEPSWRTPQDWTNILTDITPLDDRDLEVLRALYAGEVSYMDAEFAQTFGVMRARRRLDDAMVVITSDHGCGLGEEKHYAAGWDLHERMLQIPLIVRRPGGIDAGSVRTDPVQLHDLYPTILESAGLTPELPESARNGLSLFGDQRRSVSIAAFARPLNMIYNLWLEHPEFDRSSWDRRLLGIIEGNHKLVWSSSSGYILVDMELDPAEKTNLFESQTLIAQSLRDRLWWTIEGDPAEIAPLLANWSDRISDAGDVDPDTINSLRSLGYIGGGQ